MRLKIIPCLFWGYMELEWWSFSLVKMHSRLKKNKREYFLSTAWGYCGGKNNIILTSNSETSLSVCLDERVNRLQNELAAKDERAKESMKTLEQKFAGIKVRSIMWLSHLPDFRCYHPIRAHLNGLDVRMFWDTQWRHFGSLHNYSVHD